MHQGVGKWVSEWVSQSVENSVKKFLKIFINLLEEFFAASRTFLDWYVPNQYSHCVLRVIKVFFSADFLAWKCANLRGPYLYSYYCTVWYQLWFDFSWTVTGWTDSTWTVCWLTLLWLNCLPVDLTLAELSTTLAKLFTVWFDSGWAIWAVYRVTWL